MEIEQVIETVRGLDGALVVQPAEGDGSPTLAWGDTFLYHAPDGVVPERTQPWATITTKDYPGDEASRLGPGRFRVNVHVGRDRAAEVVSTEDPAEVDAIAAHPAYGALGWVSVVNPGERTAATLRRLLREAHEAARDRAARRERARS